MNPVRCLFFLLSLSAAGSADGQQQDRAGRFDQWDRNDDGKLTREELPAAFRKNFERVDRDGDGFISRQEDAAVGGGNGARRPNSGERNLAGVRKIADLDYAGTGNPRHTLDLYLPEEPVGDKPLPLLVFVHGGGWQKGDKAIGLSRIRKYVPGGEFVGASIGYRLSSEATWPAQIHDCKAAIRWLRAHAEKYGFDPDRIAVWGTSAGGHLVAMLGVSGGVEGLEGEIGEHLDQPSEVQAVVNFFGPSELLTMNDHPSTIDHNAPGSPESNLVGGTLPDHPEVAKNASPITHVSADDAPMLLVHGTEDKLVPYPQSVDLHAKLDAAGVDSALLTVEEGGHGQGFGPAVDAVVAEFLARTIRGKEGPQIADQTVRAGE